MAQLLVTIVGYRQYFGVAEANSAQQPQQTFRAWRKANTGDAGFGRVRLVDLVDENRIGKLERAIVELKL